MAGSPEKEAVKERTGLRGWARDGLIALLIVAAVFGGIFAYTQVWPPLVVIESPSMQHGHTTSAIGVIDTGDLVLVQSAPTRGDVVTWVEGRVSGHSTYGDYGDVIIFRRPFDPVGSAPVIHRAILYVVPNATAPGTFDVPDLTRFPTTEWEGRGASWAPVEATPRALREVTIHGMGYRRDLGITFNLTAFSVIPGNTDGPGFITMGDNNAYDTCIVLDPCGPARPYDTRWVVSPVHIIGRARGEIPWFGLLKLTFAPTGSCCDGWGDTQAPTNSWESLAISLVALIALPFAVEIGGWTWDRFVASRLHKETESAAPEETKEPEGDAEPRSESSGP